MLTSVLGELMAKPDLDDGWYKLSHELDAALAAADWTKAARVALRVVFSQIYGPAKRRTATLSPSAIGHNLKKPKQWAARGIKELVEGNALRKLDNGDYRFVKNYERWTYLDGTKRLSPEEVEWAKRAPKDSMTDKHGCVIKIDDQPSSKMMTNQRLSVIKIDDETSSKMMTPTAIPPHTPPIRTEELESIEDSKSAQRAKPDSESSDSSNNPEQPETDYCSRAAPGRMSREADELAEWAEKLPVPSGGSSYPEMARELCDYYPAHWIQLLLQRQVMDWGKMPSRALLGTILAAWDKAKAPESRYLSTPQTSTSTYPQRETIAEKRRREREKFRGMNFGEPTSG